MHECPVSAQDDRVNMLTNQIRLMVSSIKC